MCSSEEASGKTEEEGVAEVGEGDKTLDKDDKVKVRKQTISIYGDSCIVEFSYGEDGRVNKVSAFFLDGALKKAEKDLEKALGRPDTSSGDKVWTIDDGTVSLSELGTLITVEFEIY